MHRETVPSATRAAMPGPIVPEPAERGVKPSRRAQLVLVYSGKGGVGTSVVAVNLATALIEGGASVGLVDLNLQYGDVRLLLHLEDHPTSIESLARGGGHIDVDAVEGAMATSVRGIRALLAPSHPAAGDLVTPPILDDILLHLCRRYEYVVVDSPAHLDERVVAVMEVADHVVLVSSTGIASVKDAKVTLKLLQSLGIDRDRVALVLNQTGPRSSLTAPEVERALRFPVLASLPFDPRMEAAVDGGHPLVGAEPESAFTRGLQVVAAHVGRAGDDGGTRRLRRPAALWRVRFGR